MRVTSYLDESTFISKLGHCISFVHAAYTDTTSLSVIGHMYRVRYDPEYKHGRMHGESHAEEVMMTERFLEN